MAVDSCCAKFPGVPFLPPFRDLSGTENCVSPWRTVPFLYPTTKFVRCYAPWYKSVLQLGFGLYGIHNLVPVALGSVYPVETSTSLYNIYITSYVCTSTNHLFVFCSEQVEAKLFFPMLPAAETHEIWLLPMSHRGWRRGGWQQGHQQRLIWRTLRPC